MNIIVTKEVSIKTLSDNQLKRALMKSGAELGDLEYIINEDIGEGVKVANICPETKEAFTRTFFIVEALRTELEARESFTEGEEEGTEFLEFLPRATLAEAIEYHTAELKRYMAEREKRRQDIRTTSKEAWHFTASDTPQSIEKVSM